MKCLLCPLGTFKNPNSHNNLNTCIKVVDFQDQGVTKASTVLNGNSLPWKVWPFFNQSVGIPALKSEDVKVED